MQNISLADYANSAIEKWMDNQVSSGRAFPDTRDGLKDVTRAIFQSVAKVSNNTKKSVKMPNVLSQVSDLKEGSEETNMSILYRMAASEYPLFDATNWKLGGKQNTLNVITGSESKARYISISLTPLGEYLLTYLPYFDKSYDISLSSETARWTHIRTPLPLSLLIPQINLADGVSNSAPGFDLVELVDAFIEHIKKDKQTTTADIAQHLRGPSLDPNTTVLMSPQALHDMIEYGVGKFVQLSNIEVYKKDIVVKGLPFKTFGKTVMKDLEGLQDKANNGDWTRGITTHTIHQILPESSSEAVFTIGYKLMKGSTVADLKEELYRKSKLKSIIVYENIVNDFTSDEGKVMTVKSVRDVFDYHYDEAITLKRLQLDSKIKELEAKFGDAVFMEKITKPIVAEIVASVITDKQKKVLAKKYLTEGKEVFRQYLEQGEELDLTGYSHIAHVIPQFQSFLASKAVSLSDEQGVSVEEAFTQVLDEEIPSDWTDNEIRLIFTEQYSVLYKLDEREQALQTIENFKNDLEFLKSRLELDNVKQEIIRELEMLKMQYVGKPKNQKLFALPFQERERMKEYRKIALKEMKSIPSDLPVNVLISHDGYAKLSFSLSDSLPNLKMVIQATMADNLVVVNRNNDSFKVSINSLTMTPQKLINFEDALFVVPQDHNYLMESTYILVTNKGRISRVSEKAFAFKQKEIKVGIAEDEFIVFARRIPQFHYDNGDVILMKTLDNKFKGIMLFELAVKNTLVEFYNMFTSVPTELVHTVDIVPNNTLFLNAWKNGFENVYANKIRCRNVSKPLDADFKSPDAEFTYGKVLSWGDGNVICDYNGITGEAGFVTLSPPFKQEDISLVDESISFNSLSELALVDVHSTVSRLAKGPFEVSDLQIEILVNKYGGGA